MKYVLFREKEPKSFLISCRKQTPRKLCCAAPRGTTHNDFLAILTGGEKICNLLLRSIDTSFAQACSDYYWQSVPRQREVRAGDSRIARTTDKAKFENVLKS